MTKAKKKQLSDFAQKKRIEQNKKRVNPFEVHINKDKQNVLGRKSKADKGLPGVSRAKAISKRKGTLLQEYKLKNKDNVFLDKRIGEKNSAMSSEEKAMARFAAERIKAHKKKNIFSLNDEEVLTHRGQTLEEIEKFDDPKSDDEFSDDENKTGKLDSKFVGNAHFGGGILSKPDSAKSRKDLIEQLIAESKKRKAEKQKIREETIDLTQKLDSEWKDLLPIVSAANKSLAESELTEKPKADDYDVAVRELKFEARGTPSEKLKSEEEIIKEEKEKLEALEADRLARMKGFLKDTSNEIKHKSADDLDDGFIVETVKEEQQVDTEKDSAKDVSGDEAEEAEDEADEEEDAEDEADEEEDAEDDDDEEKEDNEVEDEEEEEKDVNDDEKENEIDASNKQKKKKLQDQSSAKHEVDKESDEDDIESDSEGDNLSDLKESESSSEDESSPAKKNVTFGKNTSTTSKQKQDVKQPELKSILKSKNDTSICKTNDEDRQKEIREDLLKRKEVMEKARKELPYTFKAPESFEELEKLLQDRSPDYQSVIIDRIIKCNHWTLDGKNKEKLSNLFLYLLQHINNCAVEDSVETVVNCFKIVDRLSPYLYDLAHVHPEITKTFIQEIIKEKHDNFELNQKKYPGLDTLIFFKLVSLLFPTSDFRHPVTTPCLIFMSQIILRCRIKNRVDVSKGLFLCTLILEYTILSKRFPPSVINFLRGVLYTATPKHLIQGFKTIPPFKTSGPFSNLLVIEEDISNTDIDPNTALMTADDLVCTELDHEFKTRAVLTAINLLNEFKKNLEELEAAHSIFMPIIKLLKANSFGKYPMNIKKHIKSIRKELKCLKDKKLQYIVREKKKPKSLRMYEPRIERVYDGKKYKTMSKEKAEREKLLHKYKKETKGAMREIRRDRSFLAKVQIKQQVKSDAERKRKVREIFGDAAVQQSELKKMKRNK